MRAWKYEMRKMFFHQNGLLFISLFFVLSLGSMFFWDKPATPEIEMNFPQYSFYLNQVQGPYSERTERLFADESGKISDAKIALQKATDDYYDGKMTEDHYLTVSAPLEKTLQNEKGFKLIYDQYAYIREHPGNRYFVYTNGWDGLLSNDSLDFLLLLLLLLLITPVFCFEFESKMPPLILTVKKGTKNHAVCKVLLASVTVVVLCLAAAGLRYGFYQLKYGLENGSYPLQSLSYFGTSIKKMTLFGAFLRVTAYKIFGNLCFAILIMFVSVCIKKYAFTLFSCTALILLPYYGFSLESSKYFLPGPLGFMVSTGFFRGSEYRRNMFKDRMDVVFREITSTTGLLLFAATLCISIAMFMVILMRHTNVWEARNRRRRLWLKPFSLILLICAAVFGLSGCASESTGKNDIYNYSARQSFENDRYRFYTDETDPNHMRILFEDKKNGEKKSLVRNPMQSLTTLEDAIYGNGSRVYYMKYDSEKAGLREVVDRFSVMEVNTTTFQEKIVFERNLSTDKNASLGLKKTNDKDLLFLQTISAFFLDRHSIYFIGQDEIRRVDRLTGKMKVIIRCPVIKSVAFDGRYIYYVDEKSHVVRFDTRTDSETVIPELVTDNFILTDSELLFVNRKDQQRMYALNLRDSAIRKITDVPVLEFHNDGQSIIYVSKTDLKQYRIN